MNAVEINACWVEAIKREQKGRVLYENFDFNPKNLIILSEKPMASKQTFGQNPEDTAVEMEELKKKLGTLAAVPRQKYQFPMTSSQEVGWETDELFNQFKPKII